MKDFLKNFGSYLLLGLKTAGMVLLCIFIGCLAYTLLYALFVGLINLLGTVAGIVTAFLLFMVAIAFGFGIADTVKMNKKFQESNEKLFMSMNMPHPYKDTSKNDEGV